MIETKSPFTAYSNAVLHLPRIKVGVGLDKFGDQKIEKEIIKYICVLDPAKAGAVAMGERPGLNVKSSYVSGYLIEPYELPVGIELPIDCEIEIKEKPGLVRAGRIKLLPFLVSPYAVDEAMKYCNKIEGWFYYQ